MRDILFSMATCSIASITSIENVFTNDYNAVGV